MACGRPFPGGVDVGQPLWGEERLKAVQLLQCGQQFQGQTLRDTVHLFTGLSLGGLWPACPISWGFDIAPIRIPAHCQISRSMVGGERHIAGAAKADAGDIKGPSVELHTLVSAASEIADEPQDSDQAGPLPDKCVGSDPLHAICFGQRLDLQLDLLFQKGLHAGVRIFVV